MTNLLQNLGRDLTAATDAAVMWRGQAQLKRDAAAECDAKADEADAYAGELRAALGVLQPK